MTPLYIHTKFHQISFKAFRDLLFTDRKTCMQKQNLLCKGNQKVKLWKLRISFVGVSGTVIRGMNMFLNGRRNLSKAVNKDDMWTPQRKAMAGLEARHLSMNHLAILGTGNKWFFFRKHSVTHNLCKARTSRFSIIGYANSQGLTPAVTSSMWPKGMLGNKGNYWLNLAG